MMDMERKRRDKVQGITQVSHGAPCTRRKLRKEGEVGRRRNYVRRPLAWKLKYSKKKVKEIGLKSSAAYKWTL